MIFALVLLSAVIAVIAVMTAALVLALRWTETDSPSAAGLRAVRVIRVFSAVVVLCVTLGSAAVVLVVEPTARSGLPVVADVYSEIVAYGGRDTLVFDVVSVGVAVLLGIATAVALLAVRRRSTRVGPARMAAIGLLAVPFVVIVGGAGGLSLNMDVADAFATEGGYTSSPILILAGLSCAAAIAAAGCAIASAERRAAPGISPGASST